MSKAPSSFEPQKGTVFRDKRIAIESHLPSRAELQMMNEKMASGKILNTSMFGVQLSLDLVLPIDRHDRIDNLICFLDEIVIYEGRGVVTHVHQAENSTILGIALDESGIDLDQVKSIIGMSIDSTDLSSVRDIIFVSKYIDDEFKIAVSDLNTAFRVLQKALEKEEATISQTGGSENKIRRLEEQTVTMYLKKYENELNEIFQKFMEITARFSDEQSRLHKKYFRANFWHYIDNTPFLKRALDKPLGYAGDFGLMLMFYEYEDVGSTLFNKLLHRLNCNKPAAVANKNRVHLLAHEIGQIEKEFSGEKFKVASLACGPAREIQLFLLGLLEDGKPKQDISLIMADSEPRALEAAQKRVRKIIGASPQIQATFYQENLVMGLIKKDQFFSTLNGVDCISCAGLFDYLSDRVASRLIERFYECLAVGGTMYIGNVAEDNPDVFAMDYFTEWSLILRNRDELVSLISPSFIENVEYEVLAEPLELNLFLKIKKLR